MRAKEFTINVPITITINGDEDPVVNAGDQAPPEDELHQNPVMVSPQQQEIELAKAALGKSSPVIDKLTADHSIGSEPEQQEDPALLRIKQLMAR
jgi:hypothetical protein